VLASLTEEQLVDFAAIDKRVLGRRRGAAEDAEVFARLVRLRRKGLLPDDCFLHGHRAYLKLRHQSFESEVKPLIISSTDLCHP